MNNRPGFYRWNENPDCFDQEFEWDLFEKMEDVSESDDDNLLVFWAPCLFCVLLLVLVLVVKLKLKWPRSLNFFQRPENRGRRRCMCNATSIGKMVVTNNLIAKGSNGTIVLEGEYDGRRVAVKRLLRSHHHFARTEISSLIVSDRHPNIIRLYGVEFDPKFVYLCLERCTCNLYDFITCCASYSLDINRSKMQLVTSLGSDQELQLWNNNGLPSALLLRIMSEVACGLEYLHHDGITHRDLKPHNILLNRDRRSISSKISDMGISKRLDGDVMPSLYTGLGSSGWQAPEQLHNEPQTCAIDLFALGCMYYFCLSRGEHPFGTSCDRDYNISRAQKDLSSIDHLPEAKDLISRLLNHNPNMRPNAREVKQHPLFWNSDLRISFLVDVSDRLEKECSKRSVLLQAFEGRAKYVLDGKSWKAKMDDDLIKDLVRCRRYRYKSLQDLVRVIRNKKNHPSDHILGAIPEGFYSYFSTRFPRLVIERRLIRLGCCNSNTIGKAMQAQSSSGSLEEGNQVRCVVIEALGGYQPPSPLSCWFVGVDDYATKKRQTLCRFRDHRMALFPQSQPQRR